MSGKDNKREVGEREEREIVREERKRRESGG